MTTAAAPGGRGPHTPTARACSQLCWRSSGRCLPTKKGGGAGEEVREGGGSEKGSETERTRELGELVSS